MDSVSMQGRNHSMGEPSVHSDMQPHLELFMKS